MSGVSVERMRSLMEGFRDKFRVPAVGAAVLSPQGEPNIEVVGVRRRGYDTPATGDDQWHIGSCGKSITALLYARLVEHGDAEWGAPLIELFPDLADRAHPGWRDRTIDEVLVCRSGMRGNLSRTEMVEALKNTDPRAEQRTKAALSVLSTTPGRRGRFVYSNLGYVVAGAAIDRVTSVPFEDALAEYVYQPLGITSGGMGPPRGVWGHGFRFRIGDLCLGLGAPADPADPNSDNPAVMNSAGRMHLTLAEWARVQRVFLTAGLGFLRPETIEHLLTVPRSPGTPMAMGWARATNLGNASYGMQGSNTFWSATALLDRARERTVMVACNDGRTRVLQATAKLAADILQSA